MCWLLIYFLFLYLNYYGHILKLLFYTFIFIENLINKMTKKNKLIVNVVGNSLKLDMCSYCMSQMYINDTECVKQCLKQCQRGHFCGKQHFCYNLCPDCEIKVTIKLDCGHTKSIFCYTVRPEFTATDPNCTQKCIRELDCGHTCENKCNEPCGPCKVIVSKKFPSCNHEIDKECHTPIMKNEKCEYLVETDKSHCGHSVIAPCHVLEHPDSNFELSKYCTQICGKTLEECLHKCKGTCIECHNGRFHIRCKEPCDKILICGHKCESSCSSSYCPPCQQQCETKCSHKTCPRPCGFICIMCSEPCENKCPHLKCSKKCFEICDVDPCLKNCKVKTQSSKKCIGICGDPCPPESESIPENIANDDSKLLEASMGIETDDDSRERKRYIYLPDCMHLIEENVLLDWIRINGEGEEICIIHCPFCRKSIQNHPRLTNILKINKDFINKIKEITAGNPFDNQKLLANALKKLAGHKKEIYYFESFKTHLLKLMLEPSKKLKLVSKDDAAVICNWADFWIDAENYMHNFTSMGPTDKYELRLYYEWIFSVLKERTFPLSKREVNDFTKEQQRCNDIKQFFRRRDPVASTGVEALLKNPVINNKHTEAHDLVFSSHSYTTEHQSIFRKSLLELDEMLKNKLQITDLERREIIHIFGSSGGAGRWFKCPNGHVYVVTECGGVTEMGKCNECGETIGGQDHIVMFGNQLATEMDGATIPLFTDNFPEYLNIPEDAL